MNKVFKLQKHFTHKYKNISIYYKPKYDTLPAYLITNNVLEVTITDDESVEHIIYKESIDKVYLDLTNDNIKQLIDGVVANELELVEIESREKQEIENERILKIKRLVDEFRFWTYMSRNRRLYFGRRFNNRRTFKRFN